MRHQFSLALAAVFATLPLGRAVAQIAESGYSLPLALALKAATASIASCASNGYLVSAVVVDPSGVVKLEAKGDHSTIHTTTSAFRKAYTVVTFGPIFRFDASSAFASLAAKNSNGAALATLPDIAPLPAASPSRPEMRSSLRSVSPARPAATKMRSARKPESRASKETLQARSCMSGKRSQTRSLSWVQIFLGHTLTLRRPAEFEQ
jgi:uncharacterized protein GlcG (DUF336 family)